MQMLQHPLDPHHEAFTQGGALPIPHYSEMSVRFAKTALQLTLPADHQRG